MSGNDRLTSRIEIVAAVDLEKAAAVARFARAVGEDIGLLAALHDREPDARTVAALQTASLSERLNITLAGPRAQFALQAFDTVVTSLPSPITDEALDELAVAYADVYLRHYYRASPTELVWMTEYGLERQAPMFAVRERYRRHDLVVTDWANRPDDHIVIELRYVAELLGRAERPEALVEPAQFLDDHVLRWIGQFADRLAAAQAPDLYIALALVTVAYLDELRGHLVEITGFERPSSAADASAPDGKTTAEAAYLPGVAPSW